MLQETGTTNSIPIIAIIISVFSLLISISSFVVSYLNFRRDKYKVVVDLDSDNGKHHVGMRSNVVETWGAIFVRNEGRRPVFINEYVHLIRAINGKRIQIGNNQGRINGWIGANSVYGKCIAVES